MAASYAGQSRRAMMTSPLLAREGHGSARDGARSRRLSLPWRATIRARCHVVALRHERCVLAPPAVADAGRRPMEAHRVMLRPAQREAADTRLTLLSRQDALRRAKIRPIYCRCRGVIAMRVAASPSKEASGRAAGRRTAARYQLHFATPVATTFHAEVIGALALFASR